MPQSVVAAVSADRRIVDVDGLIVGGEQLDAVAVGIAKIDEHGEGRAGPRRTPLDIVAEAEPGGDIAGVKQPLALSARQ
jgi:hypothetical protein